MAMKLVLSDDDGELAQFDIDVEADSSEILDRLTHLLSRHGFIKGHEGEINPAPTSTSDLSQDYELPPDEEEPEYSYDDEEDGKEESVESMLNSGMTADEIAEALTMQYEKMWSGNVKTKWEPKEGTFTGSASSIAKSLKRSHKTLKSAMSALNYYINRAGDNLSKERKQTLDRAKEILRDLYGA